MRKTDGLVRAWLAFASAAIGMAAAQVDEVVLHSFTNPPQGASPSAGVVRDSDGNLYGTTSGGGKANAGVVYKLDPSGHLTVLYSFTGGADGASPNGGVIRDSSGSLYGTTTGGGTSGWGVVFKLDATGHEMVLYSFTGGADGREPYAGVIQDSQGNLYGTASRGGTADEGVAYKIDPVGNQTVLHNFRRRNDARRPHAGVIRDSAGNLYGTTVQGGTFDAGAVYKLDTGGHETVLDSFAITDGSSPYAGVIRDAAGNLYGTAYYGGAADCGVVYRLDTTGRQTILHNFTGQSDGGSPYAGVILDSAGNLFGTTHAGGKAGHGVIYKLDAAGNETVLFDFQDRADGRHPGGLILDAAGNFYGATISGGPAGLGVVYKLDATGHQTVLHKFTGGPDGYTPFGITRDSAGNLYGTTAYGGPANMGVVYKLDSAGVETPLYRFTGGLDGGLPVGVPVIDSAHNLYGTATFGGSANAGVVYKLDAGGHETVLHNFKGGADGSNPHAGVIRDSAGNLYGTTSLGGGANVGVVYKLDSTGHETVLYSFKGGADGSEPFWGVVLDSAGNLYGTTRWGGTGGGVVYKVDAAGHETVLHRFAAGADGTEPSSGVILDSAGNLYGTTSYGGTGNAGVVYKLDASGRETVLHSFSGLADGYVPIGGLALDPAGNLYGTTLGGGAANAGGVFKLDTSSHETVLYSFTGGVDGRQPTSGVIRDPAGNLWGTTEFGGKWSVGVLFKLKDGTSLQ